VAWSWPTLGVGTLIALVVLIVTVILAAMHLVDLPWALAVCAVCALRL
jgi:hypothetical protein